MASCRVTNMLYLHARALILCIARDILDYDSLIHDLYPCISHHPPSLSPPTPTYPSSPSSTLLRALIRLRLFLSRRPRSLHVALIHHLVHLGVHGAAARAVQVPCEGDGEESDEEDGHDDGFVGFHCDVVFGW